MLFAALALGLHELALLTRDAREPARATALCKEHGKTWLGSLRAVTYRADLRRGFEARDYERMARICLPLQEARRQKMQLAQDARRVVVAPSRTTTSIASAPRAPKRTRAPAWLSARACSPAATRGPSSATRPRPAVGVAG